MAVIVDRSGMALTSWKKPRLRCRPKSRTAGFINARQAAGPYSLFAPLGGHRPAGMSTRRAGFAGQADRAQVSDSDRTIGQRDNIPM